MPAPVQVRPRERFTALAAVALIQAGLILVLLNGFHVDVGRTRDSVERLIDITLQSPPPRLIPPLPPKAAPRERRAQAAPKAAPAPPGGTPGPRPSHAPPAVTPVIALQPSAPPAGGGTGSGPAQGAGAGGGTGGNGYGADDEDDGGVELEQIAGEILPSDYPKGLGRAGVGGRVGFVFTVGVSGRVTRCAVTRSSGVPQLDGLTCRLIVQRFRYRPSTNSAGRPIEDEVEGEHVWSSSRY
ncbi:periplasmic protein TonB [Sphingomonas sp. F9_3S_D5_B_2]